MEVTFQLTPQDVKHLEKYLARRNRLARGVGTAIGLVLGALMIGLQESLKWRGRPFSLRLLWNQWSAPFSSPNFWRAWPFMLPALLIPLIFFFVVRHLQKRELQRQPLMNAPLTIRLEKAHLFASDVSGETRTRWQAIKEIGSDAQAFYFFLDNNAAHFVPQRAFATPAEAETFFEAARQLHAEAQNAVA